MIQTKSENYDEFVEKFEPKKTTDDCYTPPAIYEAVKDYVLDKWEDLEGYKIERPFYPGGDYQKDAESYDDKTVVIDNPPFSILSKIVDYYIEHNIKFFLFAPTLTALTYANRDITIVAINEDIIYENKAKVKTCFITNMESPYKVIWCQELHDKIVEAQPHRMKFPKTFRDPGVYTMTDFIREKRSVKKVDVIEHVRKNSKGKTYFGTALHIKE